MGLNSRLYDNYSDINNPPLQLFESESCTYTYLIGCMKTKEALLVDPVDIKVKNDCLRTVLLNKLILGTILDQSIL